MQRCLQLAQGGLGQTAPNPLVGCVIVHDNQIIGEGFHRKFGSLHAEPEAIAGVTDKALLKNSTLYVNLEPCAHFGKTPPCVDAILASKIPEVVIACTDPFEKVNGSGIQKLKAVGVSVTTGIMETEGRFLNRRFFTFHEKKRPYIILKWAQSADGFMDAERTGNVGVQWISSQETKKLVHLWRSKEASILIGSQTAINDNPSLTVREVEGKNPLRILFDPRLDVQADNAIFSKDTDTWVFNSLESSEQKGTARIKCAEGDFLNEALQFLHSKNIQSILVEGGRNTIQRFLQSGIWDEIRIIESSIKIGSGLKAPQPDNFPTLHEVFGQDRISYIFA